MLNKCKFVTKNALHCYVSVLIINIYNSHVKSRYEIYINEE